MKNAFVLGGTGTIGTYVVRELLSMGYQVDAATMDETAAMGEWLTYYKSDFLDFSVIREFLADRHYNLMIDFMTYHTAQFAERYELLLSHTDQFFFLSSYRVYSDRELPTTELSPRLLDVETDKAFLASDDYSLFKAREENILRSSKFDNWTILRPAITYSSQRIAFVTLELPLMLRRSGAGKPVYIPKEACGAEATLTWAGDVARLISRLVQNPKAARETFSVCTGEHQTWGTIAGYYREILGTEIYPIPTEDYLNFFGNQPARCRQLRYDRCLNRVMDNTKILNVTGESQRDFLSIRDGIEKMIAEIPQSRVWPQYTRLLDVDAAMDEYGGRRTGPL